MRIKTYYIPIAPMPWKRPARNGKKMYDAQAKDKVNFGIYLNQQHNDEPLFDCPIHLDINFYMPIPKSVSLRKQVPYHSSTPDIDNLLKFCLDTMTDVVIIDDRIICSITAKKVYDKEPRIELTITEAI